MTIVAERQGVEAPGGAGQVERLLAQIDRLPTLPAVAVRLLSLTVDPASRMDEVVRLLASDAALTAAVLSRARRADLGVSNRTLSVDRAVGLLGLRTVRALVLSVSIHATLPSPLDEERARRARNDLWKHSLAVGCAAEMLAGRVRGKLDPSEAFVCGLLHDIGKIALDVVAPKSFARVVDHITRLRGGSCDAEREVLGIDHTLAGKRLVSRWGMPTSVVESVWLHHHPASALPAVTKHPKLVGLIHVADGLVRRQHVGMTAAARPEDLLASAAGLGVSAEALDDVAVRLPEAIEPFCELVGLDVEVSRTLYAESLSKANADLARLNAELDARNAELTRRAACFDVLREFSNAITEQAEPAAVCVAAARSLRSLAEESAVVVVAIDQRTGELLAATAGAERAPWQEGYGALEASPFGEALATLGDVNWEAGLRPAGGEFTPLWRYCTGTYPSGTLWMLPLLQGGKAGGIVLFCEAPNGRVDARSGDAEWRAVGAALALAVGCAQSRYMAERTSEALLEAHRRLTENQRDSVRARSVDMVAQWAAGAAHELNNPLAVISGRAQMELAGGRATAAEAARTWELIVDEARRASQIVLDLMQFAKPDPPGTEVLVLADVLESGRQRWQSSFQLSAEYLDLHITDPSCTCQVDPAHLTLVLDAVVSNAAAFTDAANRRIVVNSPSRSSDEIVRIVVEDNGAGMTSDVLEHAFDPFFSSRPAGRGRGLGLSRAYRLVEINGGQIWLRSTPHVGTIVTIELPSAGAASDTVFARHAAQP